MPIKEKLSSYQVMEKLFETMQEFYPGHDKKADGIIQFHLQYNEECLDCFVESKNDELKLNEGVANHPNVRLKSTLYNWLGLASGTLNPAWGVISGKLKFSGDTSFFEIIPKKINYNQDAIPQDAASDFEKNPQKHWKVPEKIIVLSASPRGENGYTDFYLKSLIAGMEKKSSVEIVHLSKYKIKPCTGCFKCWVNTPGECIYHKQDDYLALAEKLLTADVIVYGFPLYADGVPGIMKNYFDRSVSRAHPFIIDGIYKVRHPRRFIKENQSMVVFSICGFFEMANFDPVKSYFNALSHNRHCPVIGEIYRTCAVGLFSNPFFYKALNEVLSALEKAGEEIVLFGKIKNGTKKMIQQKVEIKSKDLDKVNQWWVERLEDGDNNY